MKQTSAIKQNIVFFIMLFALIGVDQLTKYLARIHLCQQEDYVLINRVLRFHYLENRGAAWGLLQGQFGLFVVITAIVSIILVIFFLRIPSDKKFIILKFTITLLGAGSLGNFIDRAVNRYVVDFIYFEIINFPVFNMADIYVCVSAFLLGFLLIFRYKEEDLSWKKK